MGIVKQVRSAPDRGVTVVELVISAVLLASVLFAALEALRGNRELADTATARTETSRRVRELLDAVQRETARANGIVPRAFTTAAVGANGTELAADDVDDFPPEGALVVAPAATNRERVLYQSHQPGLLGALLKGACDSRSGFPPGTELHWAGAATVLADPASATPNQIDGQALGLTGPLSYRGLGTGFCFQVPTDPSGNQDFLEGIDIRWGSKVGDVESEGAYAAFQYEVVGQADESDGDIDINQDGDLDDVFDLGRVVLWHWDLSTPGTQPSRSMAGPANIVQERCNWGGDLDGDGFSDPLFLWDPEARSLTVRITALATVQNRPPQVLRSRATLFLRNATPL